MKSTIIIARFLKDFKAVHRCGGKIKLGETYCQRCRKKVKLNECLPLSSPIVETLVQATLEVL